MIGINVQDQDSVPVPAKILALTPTVNVDPLTTDTMLYVDAQPASKYEHVHESLGHPGTSGMMWHRKNTPGADFTDEDANMPRVRTQRAITVLQ